MATVRLLALSLVLLAGRAGEVGGQSRYADARGDISIVVSGDAILNRVVSVHDEPDFLGVVELIREATVAYTNLETPIHDYEPDAFPSPRTGTYQRAPPRIARELAWLGFDMVSTANNHTMDFGVGAMRSTIAAVEAAGLTYAGSGDNLALARAPGYRETPGGRVALIAASSTFPDHYRAGHQRADLHGRPGLSPIRVETTYVVTPAQLDALLEIQRTLTEATGDLGPSWTPTGRPPSREADRLPEDAEVLTFQAARYEVGEQPGVRTRPHEGDLAEILAAVREARRQANWVIVSSHTHQGRGNRWVPPAFLRDFAHAVIDAGADVFVAHGPKNLRGIEIYRGRPVFYSLGILFSQSSTAELQAYDNYEGYTGVLDPFSAAPGEYYDARNVRSGGGRSVEWERWSSAIASIDFRGGELREIRVHPINLGFGLHRAVQGRPLLARGEVAAEVLEGLRVLSERLGTRMEIHDGVGVIRTSERRSEGR